MLKSNWEKIEGSNMDKTQLSPGNQLRSCHRRDMALSALMQSLKHYFTNPSTVFWHLVTAELSLAFFLFFAYSLF